tara:strand:+ start:241 stop:603 length:363 start_codon:yes stop_codon:yes gene_type:complete
MKIKPKTRTDTIQVVKDIHRNTRKRHSAEEKIRIVLTGLRGDTSIAELCRIEGIAQSVYYSWSKEFMEAGKKRLAGGYGTCRHNRRGQDFAPRSAGLERSHCRADARASPSQKSMIGDGE